MQCLSSCRAIVYIAASPAQVSFLCQAPQENSLVPQDLPSEATLEQFPKLAHNLWHAWHQHSWSSAARQQGVSQLSASRAGLSAMVALVLTGERTPLAERGGKALQLCLAARHLSRLAAYDFSML